MKASTFVPLLLAATASLVSALADEEPVKLKVIDWLVDPLDAARNRVVPLKLYVPEADAPVPVVLFSHGLGGSRSNNAYLGQHWAEAGYVAVFMQHIGSDESVWKDAAPRDRMAAMKAAASGRAALDRLNDVPFVIDQLEKWNAEEGNPLHGKLDLTKIGMTGHSFGAVTTQGVMGQKVGGFSREEPRLTAFLPMSPSAHRTNSPKDTFGHIAKPVLCMTGTKDASPIDPTTTPESRRGVYAALPAGDKYELVFKDGEHHAFGEGGRIGQTQIPHHHPAILQISTAFWNAYLKGDDKAKAWLASDGPKKLLVEADVWAWK